jgi:HK97 gp10 family phage protein
MTSAGKADMKKQIAALRKKFTDRARGAHGLMYKAAGKACALVERTAKEKMRDATTDNSITYGKRGHHPSVPGSAPAVDAGTLRMSVTHSVEQTATGAIGRVGSTITSPPYGAYLEYGTSKMSARPWLQPSLDENRAEIKEILGEIVKGRVTESAIAEVEGVSD